MTTTTLNARVLSMAPPSPARQTRRRSIVLGTVVLALGLALLATWLIIASNAPSVQAPGPATPSTPISSPWLARVEITGLETRLVRAGYSIKVDGELDPVTKSALADYLRVDSTHQLGPFLAAELDGTVITGLRDPAAWNRRFGLDRKTTFVERPLTGPGGQLDANGNVVQR